MQKTDIIFSHSSVKLTHAMKTLLNHALNFSILQVKLDISQVPSPPKRNPPKNRTTSSALKTMLKAIRSEIMDPRNQNQEKFNLPQEELNSLKELRKERVIIIKAAYKGARIVILYFKVYMTFYCQVFPMKNRIKPQKCIIKL